MNQHPMNGTALPVHVPFHPICHAVTPLQAESSSMSVSAALILTEDLFEDLSEWALGLSELSGALRAVKAVNKLMCLPLKPMSGCHLCEAHQRAQSVLVLTSEL